MNHEPVVDFSKSRPMLASQTTVKAELWLQDNSLLYVTYVITNLNTLGLYVMSLQLE